MVNVNLMSEFDKVFGTMFDEYWVGNNVTWYALPVPGHAKDDLCVTVGGNKIHVKTKPDAKLLPDGKFCHQQEYRDRILIDRVIKIHGNSEVDFVKYHNGVLFFVFKQKQVDGTQLKIL